MKKYLTSFVFVVLFGGYAALQYLNSANVSYATSASSQQIASDQTQTQVQTQASDQLQPIPALADTPAENASDGGSDDSSESAQQPVQPAPIATAPSPAPIPVAKPKGQFVDGTYTGSVANAYYGNVQVQTVISGGKLANVSFLQYPNDRSTSRFINQQAMPILISEAIQAQSASVNGVSGASDTSAAFQESLASALAQAKS